MESFNPEGGEGGPGCSFRGSPTSSLLLVYLVLGDGPWSPCPCPFMADVLVYLLSRLGKVVPERTHVHCKGVAVILLPAPIV